MSRSLYRQAGNKYWKINGRSVIEVNLGDEPIDVGILYVDYSILNTAKMGHPIRKSEFLKAWKIALKHLNALKNGKGVSHG